MTNNKGRTALFLTTTSTLLGLLLGLGTTAALAAPTHADRVDSYSHSLPPKLSIRYCKTEDSHDCFWDAKKRGNGKGTSFIDYRGHVYYLDSRYDYKYGDPR